MACGVPSRNLDTWMLPHPVVSELFHRAAGAADIAVVEGVMGVFDGHSSLDEDGSTAELAKLLDAPVILIADAGKVARSVAAEVLGYQQFDPDLRVAGVILNGVGSERHLEFCQPQIEATTGLPVVGWLPRRDDLVQPERHLGLIPTAEGTVMNDWYDALNAQIERTIDLDAITRIAATAGRPRASSEGVFPATPQAPRAAIAVAQDRAFSFYYQDSLDLLAAWGAEIVPFSPLDDESLPDGVGGVYLGGGFPELFAEDLSGKRRHAGIDAAGRCARPAHIRRVRRPDVPGAQPLRFGWPAVPHGRRNSGRVFHGGPAAAPGATARCRPAETARCSPPDSRCAATSSTGRCCKTRRTPPAPPTRWLTRMAGQRASAPVACGHPTSTFIWAAGRAWRSGLWIPARRQREEIPNDHCAG